MKKTIEMTVEEMRNRLQESANNFRRILGLGEPIEILITNPPDQNHSEDKHGMVDVGKDYYPIPKPEFETDEFKDSDNPKWFLAGDLKCFQVKVHGTSTIFRRKLPALTLAKLCETTDGFNEVMKMLIEGYEKSRRGTGAMMRDIHIKHFLQDYLKGATK